MHTGGGGGVLLQRMGALSTRRAERPQYVPSARMSSPCQAATESAARAALASDAYEHGELIATSWQPHPDPHPGQQRVWHNV